MSNKLQKYAEINNLQVNNNLPKAKTTLQTYFLLDLEVEGEMKSMNRSSLTLKITHASNECDFCLIISHISRIPQEGNLASLL